MDRLFMRTRQRMTTESLMLLMALLLTTVCSAHVINKRREPIQILRKMNEITNHLRDLTTAMAEFDRELIQVLSVDDSRNRLLKRSANDDGRNGNTNLDCRYGLNDDRCNTYELSQQQNGYLTRPESPGKRSDEESRTKYRKVVADLNKKRELLQTLRKVFNNAGHILEREKKWLTCNLNLGFTCQTQEYSAIADYYDFLNSADSPGKKRSAPMGFAGNA